MWNTNMEDKTQGSAHYPGSVVTCQLNLQKVAIPTERAPRISVPLRDAQGLRRANPLLTSKEQ
jgi:hypothetical protein